MFKYSTKALQSACQVWVLRGSLKDQIFFFNEMKLTVGRWEIESKMERCVNSPYPLP